MRPSLPAFRNAAKSGALSLVAAMAMGAGLTARADATAMAALTATAITADADKAPKVDIYTIDDARVTQLFNDYDHIKFRWTDAELSAELKVRGLEGLEPYLKPLGLATQHFLDAERRTNNSIRGVTAADVWYETPAYGVPAVQEYIRGLRNDPDAMAAGLAALGALGENAKRGVRLTSLDYTSVAWGGGATKSRRII